MTKNHSNENTTTDSYELDKIDKDITTHRSRALLIIILIGVTYIFLSDKKLPESAQSWGTFGDFIGGILNPIFALFAFYWLTYSVRLQIKELRDTKKELEKSADAQLETATHQKTIASLEESNVTTQKEILDLQEKTLQIQIESAQAQQQQIAIQNFESLFFELLKTKTNAVNDIFSSDSQSENAKKRYGKDAIKYEVSKFKSYEDESNWETYYRENLLSFWGSYFRICYQIVKLIDQNESIKPKKRQQYYKNTMVSIDQKKYFDIFRSTLTQYELEAFFFNCLYSYGAPKFKILLTEYGVFEPILIDFNRKDETVHRLTRYAYKYEKNAFEENPTWIKYFKEINIIDTSICPDQIIEKVKDLLKLNMISMNFVVHSTRNEAIRNATFSYKFNSNFANIPLDEFFFSENIRKHKRLKDSPYKKHLAALKDSYSKIQSANKIISELIRVNGPNINADEFYSYDILGIHRASISNKKSEIKKELDNINNYKTNISELNNILCSLKISNVTKVVLVLIKYGISYTEYSEYMKSKNPE